MVIFLNTPSVT